MLFKLTMTHGKTGDVQTMLDTEADAKKTAEYCSQTHECTVVPASSADIMEARAKLTKQLADAQVSYDNCSWSSGNKWRHEIDRLNREIAKLDQAEVPA